MKDPPAALKKTEFDELARRHGRELHLHCYRLLGSFHDSEDAVQEAFLRAWRGRDTYAGRGSFRGWLYRIATNVCLRMLERRAIARRVLPEAVGPSVGVQPLGEPTSTFAWLEPFPVSALELAADPAPGPEVRYEAREAASLAFIAALQGLPPRQRAVLLLRDVIGLSAKETASILDASVAATNSALQRARSSLGGRYPAGRPSGPLTPDPDQRRLIERYVEAWEAADVDGLVRLLAADATWSMPPWRQWHTGRADIAAFLAWAWRHGSGNSRLVHTSANGQPAFGYYRRSPHDPRWRPFAIQVLELDGDAVRSITNFVDDGLFATFGLPAAPPPGDRPTDESRPARVSE